MYMPDIRPILTHTSFPVWEVGYSKLNSYGDTDLILIGGTIIVDTFLHKFIILIVLSTYFS